MTADASNTSLAPLTDEEILSLLSPFCAHEHVALAVSGGPDSTALMIAARRLADLRADAPRITVLTVDHGLRPEAAEEVALVQRQAQALGFSCMILRVQGMGAQASRIQERARRARYRLLGQWCFKHGAALATAHALEDQAETFLMRLARGSGIDGLSGMAAEGAVPFLEGFVPLLRPLLSVRRARLAATVKAAGLSWVEDPSNRDVRFERVRMRALLPQLEKTGLSAEAIARSMRRLQMVRHSMNRCLKEVIAGRFIHHADLGWGLLPCEAFHALDEALRVRFLAFVIRLYGHGQGASLADIERLAHGLQQRIENASLSAGGFTLGGAAVLLRRQNLIFGRETGRIEDVLKLSPDMPHGVWDRRFDITFAGLEAPVEVRALGAAPLPERAGEEGHESLLKRPRAVPVEIWLSQPAVVWNAQIVALPAAGRILPQRPFETVSCRFVRKAEPDAAWGYDRYENWND